MTTVIRRGTTGGAMSSSRKRRVQMASALVVALATPFAVVAVPTASGSPANDVTASAPAEPSPKAKKERAPKVPKAAKPEKHARILTEEEQAIADRQAIEDAAYALFWPERGRCRADGMGEVRDELALAQSVPKPRTEEEDATISRLKLELARREHAHEERLRSKLDWCARNRIPDALVFHVTADDGDLCPHCLGTSVLAPGPDAPLWIKRRWQAAVTSAANGRFAVLESARRDRLGHGDGGSVWVEHFTRLGERRARLAEQAKKGAAGIRKNPGAQRCHNDAHHPGQSWMRRDSRGGRQRGGIYA